MGNPFPYPLCDRTVTVYGLLDGKVTRAVIEGCYYVWQETRGVSEQGARFDRKFLLIAPGGSQQVFPGDRIYDGIGPETAQIDWETFLPVSVPGLSEAAYARVWFWDGSICHTEAGRK